MNDFFAVAMFSNGDQILGKFTEFGSNHYIIKEPVILKTMITQNGIGSIPIVFPSKNKEISINMNSLSILPSEPIDELKEMHIKMHSNIILPKVKLS